MIQPQEIRIGNYLYYKVFPHAPESYKIIEVTSITKNGFISFINDDGKEETYYLDNFEKIAIIEEILLKFGFEIEKTNTHIIAYNDYGYQHELEINKEYKHKSWRIEQYKGGYRHLYFCHQLQNLYFALTGEELTFK